MRSPRSHFSDPWTLIDAELTTLDSYRLPTYLLDLARRGWPNDDSQGIEIDDPTSLRFLNQHRVSTLLRPRDVGERSRKHHLERLLHINGVQLRIKAAAIDVLTRLDTRGIEAIVLKGLATSDLDYPDPALRQTGDVDIAVRVVDFAETVETLRQAGYAEPYKDGSPFFLKGATMKSPQRIEIDIHTRLFERSPMSDALFVDSEELRGLPGRALGPNLRLLHAAGHFILTPQGSRRLSGLIDIGLLHDHGNVDLETVRHHAEALQVEPLVGAALRLEAQLNGRAKVLDALNSWKPPSWLDRNTKLVADRRLALDHLGRFREVQPHDRLRYVPTWLMPNRRQRRLFQSAVSRRLQTARSRVRGK